MYKEVYFVWWEELIVSKGSKVLIVILSVFATAAIANMLSKVFSTNLHKYYVVDSGR